jgi:hypothetical protein
MYSAIASKRGNLFICDYLANNKSSSLMSFLSLCYSPNQATTKKTAEMIEK